MKKISFSILLVFLFFGVFSVKGNEPATQILHNTDFSEIEDFLSDDYSQLDIKTMISDMIEEKNLPSFDFIKEALKNAFFKEIRYGIILCIKLASICIIMAFLKDGSSEQNSIGNVVFIISGIVVSFILLDCFQTGLECAKTVIKNVNSFVNMSIPVLTVFLAGCGAANTAACVSPAMLAGIEIISVVTQWVFIPLVVSLGILPAFYMPGGVFDITALTDAVKAVLKWGMGLVFCIFGGIISIYGNFASSADALSFRAAKYVAGSALPVVGSVIADGMGTFYYSCSVVKNAFGAAVMCVIFFMILTPAVKLFVLNLALNVTAVFAGAICEKSISLKIKEISGAIMYIFSLVCLTAFLFIICIAIIIHTSNNVVI